VNSVLINISGEKCLIEVLSPSRQVMEGGVMGLWDVVVVVCGGLVLVS